MILTPIAPKHLPVVIELFADCLGDGPSGAIFRRIARLEQAERAGAGAAARHHRQALEVLASLGMGILPGSPQEGFSWDGSAVRSSTEAYVLLHEAAHFQLASPERRCRIDFGLGPGPETGDRGGAERDALLFGLACEKEEAMASLLGVLWEVELGQPAFASFLDQNWLEGAGKPGAAAHFRSVLSKLYGGGFITAQGRPTRHLRPALALFGERAETRAMF